MKFEIKRLSPELTEDYINFFENIAFTDNPEWAGCYCVFFHWNDKLEAQCREFGPDRENCFRRELAIKYINSGRLRGYLAYENGSVVGWCNANDKAGYETLSKDKRPELWEDVTPADKIKSVVCYTIAPDMRRKGIATRLLDRVCLDAAREGYTCVEAYPRTGEVSSLSYRGPVSIYEKSGFKVHKDLGSEVIVRKNLFN